MVCKDCGYVMAPFETSCPRCVRLKALKKTRRMPDLRSMATQRLVQLNQCPTCKFMLFPGDTCCSSCGARVTAAPRASDPAMDRGARETRTPLIIGIVVSAVTIGVVLVLFHSFYPR